MFVMTIICVYWMPSRFISFDVSRFISFMQLSYVLGFLISLPEWFQPSSWVLPAPAPNFVSLRLFSHMIGPYFYFWKSLSSTTLRVLMSHLLMPTANSNSLSVSAGTVRRIFLSVYRIQCESHPSTQVYRQQRCLLKADTQALVKKKPV